MSTDRVEHYTLQMPGHQTEKDAEYYLEIEKYFHQSVGTTVDKLRSFTKYVPRPEISRFLVKNFIFEKILGVHGAILECGVFLGAGLMSWAQLSSIYEPLNHIRRVIGFDTFEGFPELHQKDRGAVEKIAVKGGYAAPVLEDLQACIKLYDLARPIGHIPRVELVPGNATQSIPAYIENNPHLVVALLYLDFDIYEPTRVAIESILPRMPKGAVIAFDELAQKQWPGETLAVLDSVGIRNLRIQRLPFQPQISYAILE